MNLDNVCFVNKKKCVEGFFFIVKRLLVVEILFLELIKYVNI